MAQILSPRPAATVLALRDSTRGFEVLMLRRNLTSDFVGGAYVFPGGGVDDRDGDPTMSGLTFGCSEEVACSRLGLASGALAHYVAGLRELFEEAGLLIACDEHGEGVDLGDPLIAERLGAHRIAVNAGAEEFLDVLVREGLFLDLRGLAYLAHWVTPVGPPRRYDTRFFVVLAPNDQIAAHDAGETVEDLWLRPVDALAAFEAGQFEMILPTIHTLRAISHLATSREVLNYADSLTDITRNEPRVVMREHRPVIVMPGYDGYDV